MSFLRNVCMLGTTLVSLVFTPFVQAAAVPHELLPGTKVYLALDDEVSSKRGESDVGDVVRCHVWRDVESAGALFIRAGTPATCKIDKVRRRNMGGFEGKISIAGLETKSVDGQYIALTGGYNKEGSGRKAVVWTVGLLLLWPVLFVPGGAAELPPGTVFDTNTVNSLRMNVESASAVPTRTVNLSGMLDKGFNAEFMIDEFLAQSKPEAFLVRLSKDGDWPAQFVVDNVNGKPIDPIRVDVTDKATANGVTTAIGKIGIKTLGKHFQKGINRFEVAYDNKGARVASEVLMDVQM